MDGVTNGEALIAKVYESIRNSPLWMSSMLIVTYDEHGGFYDHFAPGPAQPPDDGGDKYNEYGFTFAQYGVRVPRCDCFPRWLAELCRSHHLRSLVGSGESRVVVRHASADEQGCQGKYHPWHDSIHAPRTDCPTQLNPLAPPAVQSRFAPAELAARELEPVPERSSLMGTLGVLLKADTQLATTSAERAAAIARYQSIRTRGRRQEISPRGHGQGAGRKDQERNVIVHAC